jgi:AraC family transcriptional regulator
MMQTNAAPSANATYSTRKVLSVPRSRRYDPDSKLDSCPCREIAGSVAATRQVPGFRVIEAHYPDGMKLSRHTHEHAHLTYVLEGSYSESYADSFTVTCEPMVLRYLPPRHPHSNVFEPGSRLLIVEIEPEALRRVEQFSKRLNRPGEIQGPASMWLAQQLYRQFQESDRFSVVSMHGILLEILAEGARHAGAGPVMVIPEWLRVAREYVEANFLRSLSLAEISRVAHVHRVHLARQFRRHFSTSVGELLRHKRIQHACHLVTTTNASLADVAMACGFSDQSHFSATFRRQMSLTPAVFRQMAQR